MVPLDSLDSETVKYIKETPFKHYYLWRVVHKEDSLSTPVRLVVDPTMSGLNCVLAKRDNRICSLLNIILRSRAYPYAWSSDVTKLYNQLHLERSALPYSLFLYSDELDPTQKPATLVMQRTWYGVTPTGNQAGYALELLVDTMKDEYPTAVKPLTSHRYVDDVISGAADPETRELQRTQFQQEGKRS